MSAGSCVIISLLTSTYALMSSGLVVWAGVESLGQTDGRIALYLAESAAYLLPEGNAGIRVSGPTPAARCDPKEPGEITKIKRHGS